jgi:hypothetical protein
MVKTCIEAVDQIIKQIMMTEIKGKRPLGRSKKIWKGSVMKYLITLQRIQIDRLTWRIIKENGKSL